MAHQSEGSGSKTKQESEPGPSSSSAQTAPSVQDAPEEETDLVDDAADANEPSVQSPKKKSKRAKIKKALGGQKEAESSGSSTSASKLTPGMIDQLMEMNPSLKAEMAGMDRAQAMEVIKKLDVADLLTGLSISGKNQKDMASYKFWNTQPVPRFDDTKDIQEGQIMPIDPEYVPKEPRALYEGFEWVTMDLEDSEQTKEVYELLSGHYVEDDDAKFRLTYSASVLNWALKSPGWRKDWHVGVRASQSKKLVAFISAIPINLRVRNKVLNSSEVNFLCVHRKLRSRRLTPVLIEEITRRCYQVGVFQAIYTSGTILPKPVSTCRYFHRPLDWLKLFEIDFCGLPHGSSKARQITRYQVPNATAVQGFRPMRKADVKGVHELLERFLKRFIMSPDFTEEEIHHWFLLDDTPSPEQVVWTYVVEDPETHKITDFTSFFCLESAVIGSTKHKSIRAAYMFYYATEVAFQDNEKALKERLNALVQDTLVKAKEVRG